MPCVTTFGQTNPNIYPLYPTDIFYNIFLYIFYAFLSYHYLIFLAIAWFGGCHKGLIYNVG